MAQPPLPSTAGSPRGLVGITANMDAETVSRAIQAGATFTRFKFESLSPEEQGRILEKQRGRERQAGELAQQMEARQRERDAAKKTAKDQEIAEERRVEREQRELAAREAAEMRSSKEGAGILSGEHGPLSSSGRLNGHLDGRSLSPRQSRGIPLPRDDVYGDAYGRR